MCICCNSSGPTINFNPSRDDDPSSFRIITAAMVKHVRKSTIPYFNLFSDPMVRLYHSLIFCQALGHIYTNRSRRKNEFGPPPPCHVSVLGESRSNLKESDANFLRYFPLLNGSIEKPPSHFTAASSRCECAAT